MDEVEIRAVREEDLASLYEASVACLRDGRGMVTSLEAAGDLNAFRAQVQSYMDAENPARAVMLAAVVNGAARGWVAVHRLRPAYLRHVGVLSVELDPSVQGRGLGRRLMNAAIGWAREAGVVRLELYVRGDNDRAIRLYESVGFEREVTRAKFVRLPDGTFVDDLGYRMLL